MPAGREHDLVLLGATGFTGGLAAEYLAAAVPAGASWAIAGRDRARLEAVRERLGAAGAVREPKLALADVTDHDSMRRLARSARVVATTVGPYIRHGDPLVAACAEVGTDYVDLCGEPEFVDRCYVRHHARASETGARLVHACGFDSIPHDLGALFCVQRLPEGVPVRMEGFARARGGFSAGTYHSVLIALSRLRQNAQAAQERRRVEPWPADRRVSGGHGLPRRDGAVGAWVLPALTIDAQIVLRSARALERYGPDFSYSHYFAIKRLPGALAAVGAVAGLAVAAQIAPARSLLEGRMSSGDGPTAEQRAQGWFSVHFVAEGGGRQVVCEVRGGDPGYGETAKMLAESALCLTYDELPEAAGQLTTAVAMGDALIERLRRAGISFEEHAEPPG